MGEGEECFCEGEGWCFGGGEGWYFGGYLVAEAPASNVRWMRGDGTLMPSGEHVAVESMLDRWCDMMSNLSAGAVISAMFYFYLLCFVISVCWPCLLAGAWYRKTGIFSEVLWGED